MSATTPIQVTEKKARKPTLSAKYSKFMVFGYNFVQSLRASDILNDEGLENAYAQLKMFDTVDTQSEFYEQFLNQSGESGKVMRKFIVQRNKPPKAPRKPRAKKAAATTTTTTETTTTETAKEKKPRKPRTKKTTEVVQDTQNDVISEIVAAANADPLENIAVETTEPPVKEKKARKPRAKKVAEPAPENKTEENFAKEEEECMKRKALLAKMASKKATEPAAENKTEEDFAKEEQECMKRKALLTKMAARKKEAIVKSTEPAATTPEKKSTEPVKTPEKKAPRAPKKKKVETHVEVTPPFVESEELEEEEIVTQEIVIGGETYLIDGDNNLYSTQTHLEVGTYNQDTKEISLNA